MKLVKVILLSILLINLAYAKEEIVKIPNSGTEISRYFIDLLDLALEKTHYKSIFTNRDIMTESRYLNELKKGNLDIAWSSASKENEDRFIPIYIPLLKGLLGYRISFVKKGREDNYDKVKKIEDLRKLIIGQGIGWGDNKVYQNSFIQVQTGLYDNLFKMTSLGRFDLFPRGITEIDIELERFNKKNGIGVEKNFLIKYHWPYYFYVNKSKPQLAKALEKGLREMIKDGSFDKKFKKQFGKVIKKYNLKDRVVIELDNPLLTPKDPLDKKELWYRP